MFKNLSLKNKLILQAILPVVIVTIWLGCYFTFIRTNDLRENLIEHGKLVLTELSITATYALKRNDPETLTSFLENYKQDEKISYIAVYNNAGSLIAGSKDPQLYDIDINQLYSLVKLKIIKHNNQFLFIKQLDTHDNINSPQQLLIKSSNLPATSNKNNYWAIVAINDQVYQSKILDAIIALIISFTLGIMISVYYGFKIATEVAIPIMDAVKNIDEISKGNFKLKITSKCHGELNLLKNGINNMSGQLENFHNTMKKNISSATKELRDTLKHIAIQNDQLDEARKDALAASKAKSAFLANMSHEIRTPMNSIIGFTEILLQNETNKTQQDHLKTIDKSAKSLLHIINDILDLSKIEADSLELSPEIFNLENCIQDVIKMLSIQIKDKKLKILTEFSKNTPSIIIQDPLRLSQVLTNLVSNAIKFTAEGKIKIKVSTVNNRYNNYIIKIEVIDNGIGLRKTEVKKLFTSFSQADTSTTRRFGGTGLGLVISKKLVEKMKGDIHVISEVKKGSNFYFTFKCKTPEDSQKNIKTLPNTLVNSSNSSSSKVSSITKQVISKKSSENKSHLNIISVDDQEANLKLMDAIINNLGHKNIKFNNANDAIKYIKDHYENIDLIFMDIQMPHIDGLSAAKTIIEFTKQQSTFIPIIALTADVFADTKEKIIQSGFTGYQTKPITPEQIANKLAQLCPQLNSPQKSKLTKEIKAKNKEEIQSTNNSIIDMQSALNLTGGNEKLVKEMQQMLLKELQEEGLTISKLYKTGNTDKVKSISHKIQGGASYCGAALLRQDSRKVERICVLIQQEENKSTTKTTDIHKSKNPEIKKLNKMLSQAVDALMKTIKLTITHLNDR